MLDSWKTLRVTKSQNRYRNCRILCACSRMQAVMKDILGSWTWFFHFPESWKREPEQKKASDFEWNVCFLLLFVLKKSYSVVFAIICRHILLRNRRKWLSVAKVVKRYGIHNVCTVIIYYDTWIWWLVSHIEIFGFLYWRCFVILDYDAFVRPYCNASSL